MEGNPQLELIISIILTGTMTKTGSHVQHADLATNWMLNSGWWVNTIFGST